MVDAILELVSRISTPGFFVAVEFPKESIKMPEGIEAFVLEKYRLIKEEGTKGRKFAYQESGWRIIFTFFPTDQAVDERYALKNKVIFRKLL